jgi:hypothetical protein
MATEIPIIQLATPEVIEAAVALVEGITPDIEATVRWGQAAAANTAAILDAAASASADAAAAETARAQAAAAAGAVAPGVPNGTGTLDASGKQPESQVLDRLKASSLSATYVTFRSKTGEPLTARHVIITIDTATGEVDNIFSEAI